MDRRSEQVASTRERILDAATDLFGTRGIQGTSMLEVARRADVAPGTVLNHFDTAGALAEAVVARAIAAIQVPTAQIFDGARSRRERIRRLVAEMFAFYERSNPWFDLFRAELKIVPALQQAEQDFWAEVGNLFELALGPFLKDALLRGTAFGLVHPATLGALHEGGLSIEQSAEVISDTLIVMTDRASRRPR